MTGFVQGDDTLGHLVGVALDGGGAVPITNNLGTTRWRVSAMRRRSSGRLTREAGSVHWLNPSLSLGTTLPNEINNLGDYSGVYGTTVA